MTIQRKMELASDEVRATAPGDDFAMLVGHLLRLESELSRYPHLQEAANFVGCAALSVQIACAPGGKGIA